MVAGSHGGAVAWMDAMTRSNGFRLTVPLLVLVPLVWLMVGCVYVPWFEQANLNGARRDFRDLSGKSAADPLVDGRITADGVRRLLGPPAVRSSNGRVLVYALTTRHGVWVEPLCLNVTPGGQHLYVLGLRFDADGLLEHHRFVTADLPADLAPALELHQSTVYRIRQAALQEIDRDNGVVRVPWDRPATPGEAGVRKDFSVAGRGGPLPSE